MRRWRILLFVDESSVAGGPSFAFRIVRPWSIGGEPQVTKIALGNEQLTKWNLYQGRYTETLAAGMIREFFGHLFLRNLRQVWENEVENK